MKASYTLSRPVLPVGTSSNSSYIARGDIHRLVQ